MKRTRRQLDRAENTYRFDRLRDGLQGMLVAGFHSFALSVAIRVFHSNPWIKASIAAAEHVGYFFNATTLYLASKWQLRTTRALTWCFGFSAACLIGASWATTATFFALSIVLAKIAYRQYPTLMSEVYTQNYAPGERGQRLVVGLALSALSGMIFSYAGGRFLDVCLAHYRWIFGWMALVACACAYLFIKIPSRRTQAGDVEKCAVAYWPLLWRNSLFGVLKLGWIFLALGNAMTLPIRVEYLANPKYGINASNATLSVIIFIIPALAQMLTLRLCGRAFDTMPFTTFRVRLNWLWVLGLILYFCCHNLWLIGLGSAMVGVAMGGGMLAWSLWVTKIAEPEKVGAYMSVHTSISGLQGLLSPFVGYAIVQHHSPIVVAACGIVCTLLSSLTFTLAKARRT